VVDVPLHEVSGIYLRRSRTGRMSLIAVGDRVSKIERKGCLYVGLRLLRLARIRQRRGEEEMR
jgi:hypothetical protein